MKTTVLTSAILLGLFSCLAAVPAPAPYHSFCRALWLFAMPCGEISNTILQQIQMSAPEYTLVSATPLSFKANHTSRRDGQTQNITITFSPTVLTGGCRVSGMSTSLDFTSLLDDGLNYCNLHNLLTGSGLVSAPGFMEMTNEWACMGFSLAKCKA